MMTMDYDLVYLSPCTALGVCLDTDAVSRIVFLPQPQKAKSSTHSLAKETIRQLDAYFHAPAFRFDLPIKLSGTVYQQAVWQAIATIAPGHTLTYGDIAYHLHSGPRAVGNACGCNPLPIIIPCHRVVGKQGLGGFNRNRNDVMLNIKRWLLKHEGVQ